MARTFDEVTPSGFLEAQRGAEPSEPQSTYIIHSLATFPPTTRLPVNSVGQ